MKEYIEREAARDMMEQALVDEWEIQYADDRLDEIPTVDAVPVCRCKDCKHTKTDGMADPAIYCKKWDRWEMPSDFYCKYGERKGGDE